MLLNQRKPEFDTALNGAISAAADDFVRITLKAQAAKDYFLLVGPPEPVRPLALCAAW